jgi:hypothetical protein
MANDQTRNLGNRHREIADQLEQLAVTLRQEPPLRGWIAQFKNGEVLTSTQAAFVCQVSSQCIRSWCEQKSTTDRPLGLLIADSVWLVDLGELLRVIEIRRGRHGVLVAKDRAKKYAQIWSAPTKPTPNLVTAKS